jgi:hypothetical protein
MILAKAIIVPSHVGKCENQESCQRVGMDPATAQTVPGFGMTFATAQCVPKEKHEDFVLGMLIAIKHMA